MLVGAECSEEVGWPTACPSSRRPPSVRPCWEGGDTPEPSDWTSAKWPLALLTSLVSAAAAGLPKYEPCCGIIDALVVRPSIVLCCIDRSELAEKGAADPTVSGGSEYSWNSGLVCELARTSADAASGY